MRDLALHQSDSFCQSDWSAESFSVPSPSKVIYLLLSTSFTQQNRRATLVLLPTDTFPGKQKKVLACYNSKLTTNRIKVEFLLSMIDLLLRLITQKIAGIFWCNYPLQKGGKNIWRHICMDCFKVSVDIKMRFEWKCFNIHKKCFKKSLLRDKIIYFQDCY